jgi:hypothetical protein
MPAFWVNIHTRPKLQPKQFLDTSREVLEKKSFDSHIWTTPPKDATALYPDFLEVAIR